MKLKAFLLMMFLLAGAQGAFAEANAKGLLTKPQSAKVATAQKQKPNATCTVTLSDGNISITVTKSCDCEQREACNRAYIKALNGLSAAQ
jgi:hypothetical protein